MSIVLRAFPSIVLLPSEAIRKQEAIRNFVRTIGKQLAEAKIAQLASGKGLSADESKDILSYLSESIFACCTTVV